MHNTYGNLAMPPPPPADSGSVHSGHDSQHTQSGCFASQLLDTASTSAYSFGTFGDAGFVEDEESSSQDDD